MRWRLKNKRIYEELKTSNRAYLGGKHGGLSCSCTMHLARRWTWA